MNYDIEELFPAYFSGQISEEERARIDVWRAESVAHETQFRQAQNAWEALPLLKEMEQFNSFEALRKVRSRIDSHTKTRWIIPLQRIAAILLLPLLIYSGWITYSLFEKSKQEGAMQTIHARYGTVSKLQLPDGSTAWLNSGSSISFPQQFADTRNVQVEGEVFFDVTENKRQPFIVHAGNLNIEVLGTEFNVNSYSDENESEIVLVAGKVKLSATNQRGFSEIGTMQPGERVIFNQQSRKALIQQVEVEKYISWKNGLLIFEDEPMNEVVKRLSRWFNADITIQDASINEYQYRAKFRHENLEQVLNLLHISAPIDYRIEPSKELANGEFTKTKVYLMKKK